MQNKICEEMKTGRKVDIRTDRQRVSQTFRWTNIWTGGHMDRLTRIIAQANNHNQTLYWRVERRRRQKKIQSRHD